MSPRSRTSEQPRPHPSDAGSASRDRPMSGEQAARLKAIAGEALEPEAFHPGLSEAEAARRIRALEVKLKTMDGPPHAM